MLGLRKNPLIRRKRDSATSLSSTKSSEELSRTMPAPIDAATNSPRASPAPESIKGQMMSVTSREIHEDKRTVMDGADDYTETIVDGPTSIQKSSTTTTTIEIVQTVEVARKTKKRIIHDLRDVTEEDFRLVNLQFYLDFIGDERLIHMPARGSDWDRVLTAAEYFGVQMHEFTSHVSEFIQEHDFICDTALASCYLLLQLGCEQAEALEPTFTALYALGLLLSRTIRLKDHFLSSPSIAHDVGHLLSSLVELVGDIAVLYRRQIMRISGRSNKSIDSVVVDFDAEFGSRITDLWAKREHLINHMWRYELGDRRNQALDIVTLRKKLSTTRESVKAQIYGRVAERKERVEGTCEWIQRDLFEFVTGKEQIFTITGNGGCGKSMLASWVRERLEKHVNFRKFETLSYTFAEDNPMHSTTVSFLKSILSQLLEHSVGDVQFFENLANLFAKEKDYVHDTKKLETRLWEALDIALATRAKDKARYPRLIIIIDGLDEAVGGQNTVRELHNKIYQLVDKHIRIRAITFSRPISHVGVPGGRHLIITPDHLRDDIKWYLEDRLSKSPMCEKMHDEDLHSLVTLVATHAKGSFLFAYLAVQYLQTGVTLESYQKTIQSIKTNHAIEMLSKLLEKVNLKEGDMRSLFAFTLSAERPLTRGEMGDLLTVNLSHKRLSDPVDVDVGAVIHKAHGIIVEQKGRIRFKNSVIRNHIMKQVCGSTLMSLQEAQAHLTMSMLLFAKCVLRHKHEPSCDQADANVVHSALDSHHITEYFLYNWVSHFQSSSLINKAGDLTISQAFKDVFPDNSFIALLEWTCWHDTYGMERALTLHKLTLKIRSACFGDKHRSVLQNLVTLGSLHRSHSDITIASEFFYKAMSTGRTVLYQFNPFVVSCANIFLVLSEKITITERTTIVTYREETIRFVIEVCKIQYGAHSDAVIQWLEVLAKLYIQIRETHHAAVIYKELREIIIIRFGKDSPQARRVIKDIVGMSVVLKKDVGEGEIVEIDDAFFQATEEVDYESEFYFTMIFQRIDYYLKIGHFVFVEKLYLSLWRHVCDVCRRRNTAEFHLIKLNVAVRFIRFLQQMKRHDEASNIMVCIWAEYEHHACESETLIIRLKELAILARSFGMLTFTISILHKVWGWFKERKLVEHEEAVSTTVIVTEVVEEVTETIVETKTTTIVTETLTREIWETTYTRCKGGVVDNQFYKACIALLTLYLKLENWKEVEIITRKSLELIWKSVLTVDAKLTLEGTYVKERITIATRLAICLHRQRHLEKAEEIYLRIFRSCLVSVHAEDVCLMEAALSLINFYEEYHRHEKVIEVYVELLAHYRKHLGAKHKLTLKILHSLASTYMLLGRKEAYDCYIEILSFYIHDGHCHADGLDAAIIVLDFYYREQRWTDLQKLCVVLWNTFTHHHHEIVFSEEVVQIIYERYRYVLEIHAKVEFTVLYKLTIEYRETVTKAFGVSSAIIIASLIALAELCEKSEQHQHESVTIYEEIITKSKTTTTITETKVTTIKKRLSKLYVTVIQNGKSTSTTTIDRAIEICVEVYEKLKIELGCWHETTLLKLMELTILYKKRSTEESHAIIVRLLRESVVEIITKVTVSLTFYTAAKMLASIYIACDMVRQGEELLQQLHVLLLFPDVDVVTTGFDKGSILKLDTRVSKVSFVFLIVFEQCLHEHPTKHGVVEFSQLMADILLETLLYEQYVTVMTSFSETTRIELVLERAARLRCVWSSRGRVGFVNALDKKLFPLFRARYSQQLGQSADADAVFDFYVALLTEIGSGASADQVKVDFAVVTCKASIAAVRRLMIEEKKPDLPRAHAVAKCAYQFADKQGLYRETRCIVYGYRLAELLAGVGVPAWKTADAALKDSILKTSCNILETILKAMRETGIKLVSLRFDDLAALIRLLGEQKNYQELEIFLLSLWQSREVQRNWSPEVVLRIGTLLVQAHFLAKHPDRAIALCNTIYYNLRRSHGGLDPQALEFADRLALLLKSSGRRRDAVRVHEDVVSDLDEHMVAVRTAHVNSNGHGSNGTTTDETDDRLRAAADAHLEGLRRCGWASRTDGQKAMSELYNRLRRYGPLSVQPVEQWGPGSEQDDGRDGESPFNGTIKWVLIGSNADKEARGKKKRDSITPAKERWGCWEAPRQVHVTT